MRLCPRTDNYGLLWYIAILSYEKDLAAFIYLLWV
jgi:hypothetical protein